jgi:ribosomal protein S18 acetylase RimI-like enzyme
MTGLFCVICTRGKPYDYEHKNFEIFIMMISIREARLADYKIITGFQLAMARETENIELDPAVAEKGVKSVLTDGSKGCYYLAETGDKIAGCLMLTYEWSDWRNGRILWIQSVYVMPGQREKGVFGSLYNYIKQMVEQDPELKGIRLYVDKTNHKAIQVYRKCGMDGEHYRVFEWMRTSHTPV